MDDLLSEFLTETNENIGIVDASLVVLERDPSDVSQIDNIFRLVHTIKGTCGFLGLPRLEAVAHAGENVLGKIRDKELTVTAEVVTVILEAMDVIKDILSTLEVTEKEPEGNNTDLINRLNKVAFGAEETITHAAELADLFEKKAVSRDNSEAELEAAFQATDGPDGIIEKPEINTLKTGEVSLEELEAVFNAAPGPDDENNIRKTDNTKAPVSSDAVPKETSIANQSIRVNVDMLENLMTMVSELVLTRNQLLQMVRDTGDNEFTVPLQRLSHVTTELQEGLMKTRMQPIGNAWSKFPRIVRDLSHDLNKKIDLVMQGAETELDRQVLELIKDPLTHMIRNSADHGLEVPAERIAAGKEETGRIMLDAFHEGGHIIITIADDGRGLNTEKIKSKVIENGLANALELESMSAQQIQNFIMQPGFSTAEQVTNVSGRGVGMDVVRSNIEKIGGSIALTSEEGGGSKFTIKIPLTLAIISALIVECCSERFAIPQTSVVELVRASRDENADNAIEMINDAPVMRLRDHLLPLIHLNEALRLETAVDEVADKSDIKGPEEFVIVTQVGNYTFGIVVDHVFDTEEIVVKPIAPILKHLSIFSGNTILGDGSVIMILDPNGVAATIGEPAIEAERNVKQELKFEAVTEDKIALLVFKANGDTPKAVPLSLVSRLEEIDVKTIEISDERMVVQYRGHLMPLTTIDDDMEIAETGRLPVLVFNDEHQTMGLIVDEIIDIVEDRLNVEMISPKKGLIGSAVIRNKATDIIDVGHYMTICFGNWFDRENAGFYEEEPRTQTILLVDDSPFFRNMMVPLLVAAGYDVSVAENAAQALELREQGNSYDVIISDVEMPEIDGFEFAKKIKADERWQEIPIVALSSHTRQKDFDRGREVGFTDYVAKFDQDGLMSVLSETLQEREAAE
jgi:two-component system, chemotaxis family, sensor kinase CheA